MTTAPTTGTLIAPEPAEQKLSTELADFIEMSDHLRVFYLTLDDVMAEQIITDDQRNAIVNALRTRSTAPVGSVSPDDICAACGETRRQHHHDGNCYGLCGDFVTRSTEGDHFSDEEMEMMNDALAQLRQGGEKNKRRANLLEMAITRARFPTRSTEGIESCQGLKLVPLEPTEAMIGEGGLARLRYPGHVPVKEIYRAMVSAALPTAALSSSGGEALRQALKPFADFAERADGPGKYVVDYGKVVTGPGIMADMPDDRVLVRLDPSCPPVTVGHFRKARAALSNEASVIEKQMGPTDVPHSPPENAR